MLAAKPKRPKNRGRRRNAEKPRCSRVSGTVPFSCHLPYLARFQDFTLHYEVARDSESRCGANFVLRTRRGYHLGYYGFRHRGESSALCATRERDPTSPLHADFTDTPNVPKGGSAALIDRFGHGTHVAGIVAGEQLADGTKTQAQKMRAVTRSVKGYEDGDSPGVETREVVLNSIRGMAPRSRLVSLKVLDDEGNGEVSNLIAAIAHIQEKNGHGRLNLIHGVNISLGYDFDPEWFACGQSPLCVEINRLVRSGVVVVVAAGNTGYGALAAQQRTTNAGMQVTINDPGNAELAITVGSTHREMPHVYGVSYFSSKGPTGDGRMKPDIVAPGEKILSAATGKLLMDRAEGKQCEYVEDSGTSMAAPHVSGVIAAFLSVRREFIGEPERVKQIFLGAATDLKRERSFQGAGLIDLMRAIQSV